MKALICNALTGLDALTAGEAPPPAAAFGQVRIAMRACGVNFADVLMIQGKYQEKQTPPFIPGFEIAGEIAELGPGVAGLAVGQRVIALPPCGGFAASVAVDAARVIPIPDGMSFVQAAAFPVAYGTGHLALDHRARLRPGETLLVHGAGGGVGLVAVELGKLMGARVIATASTPEKLALARAKGADETLPSDAPDLRAAIKALGGADVVYDPVGGDLFDLSLRVANFGARLLPIGFAGGHVPQIPANILLVKNLDVIGVYWGAYAAKAPDVMAASLRQLFDWFNAGKLAPEIGRVFPLDQAADAIRQVAERRAVGKVVVENSSVQADNSV